jgi:hypothetical protein
VDVVSDDRSDDPAGQQRRRRHLPRRRQTHRDRIVTGEPAQNADADDGQLPRWTLTISDGCDELTISESVSDLPGTNTTPDDGESPTG